MSPLHRTLLLSLLLSSSLVARSARAEDGAAAEAAEIGPPASFAPPPASERRTPNGELVAGGLAGTALAYGFIAWVGAEANSHDLYIPLAGPFVHAVKLAASPLPPDPDLILTPIDLLGARANRWAAIGILAVDGVVQVGGIVIAAYGLIHGKTAPRRTASIEPLVGRSTVGVHGVF